jgi:iron complex transport system substrate-binding protein
MSAVLTNHSIFSCVCRLFIFVALVLVGTRTFGQVVEDERGVVVRFTSPPQRIVSVSPALTESVCALGQCHRLIGTDRYSNWPESVKKLPKVGGGLDPSIEAIVALRPDVVLMASSSAGAQRLEALGVRVVALEPKNYADAQRVLNTVGILLGVSNAPQVWQQMTDEVEAAARSVPASLRETKIYFEVSAGPYAASESSFIGQSLIKLGVQNIVPASLGPFPKINPEFVVRANPDLIMGGTTSEASMRSRPGWQSIRAVRENRFCVFTREQSDVLVRAGPRMAEAARIMAKCINDKAPRATR